MNSESQLTNPLLAAMFSTILTFLLFYFAYKDVYLVDSLALILVTLIFFSYLWFFLSNLLYYPLNEKYLHRILSLYLSLILLYANIYFIMSTIPNDIPFHGLHSPWIWGTVSEGRRLIPNQTILNYIDCLHYSVVTIATVGYGDIYPTQWYAKLMVDTEILSGTALIGIVLARHFSNSDKSINESKSSNEDNSKEEKNQHHITAYSQNLTEYESSHQTSGIRETLGNRP